MSQNPNIAVAVVGIDIGKNSFHVVGLEMCIRDSGRTIPLTDLDVSEQNLYMAQRARP